MFCSLLLSLRILCAQRSVLFRTQWCPRMRSRARGSFRCIQGRLRLRRVWGRRRVRYGILLPFSKGRCCAFSSHQLPRRITLRWVRGVRFHISRVLFPVRPFPLRYRLRPSCRLLVVWGSGPRRLQPSCAWVCLRSAD